LNHADDHSFNRSFNRVGVPDSIDAPFGGRTLIGVSLGRNHATLRQVVFRMTLIAVLVLPMIPLLFPKFGTPGLAVYLPEFLQVTENAETLEPKVTPTILTPMPLKTQAEMTSVAMPHSLPYSTEQPQSCGNNTLRCFRATAIINTSSIGVKTVHNTGAGCFRRYKIVSDSSYRDRFSRNLGNRCICFDGATDPFAPPCRFDDPHSGCGREIIDGTIGDIITINGDTVLTGIERIWPSVEFATQDGLQMMWRYHPMLADEEFVLSVFGFDDQGYYKPFEQTLSLQSGELRELKVTLKEREPKQD